MRTRVILADDHRIVRECLRALLLAESDMEVVGETGDGLQVADLVCKLDPDVLVLDLMMPGLNGLEVIRRVKQRSPHVRILVLSMHSDTSYVQEALRNGAVGYLLKDSSVENLTQAIRTARKGVRYLSPALRASDASPRAPETLESVLDPYDSVTPREREVLQLAAEGHTNEDIAARLCISRRTAELHRMRALTKLRIQNQTGLVKFAIRKGLVALGK